MARFRQTLNYGAFARRPSEIDSISRRCPRRMISLLGRRASTRKKVWDSRLASSWDREWTDDCATGTDRIVSGKTRELREGRGENTEHRRIAEKKWERRIGSECVLECLAPHCRRTHARAHAYARTRQRARECSHVRCARIHTVENRAKPSPSSERMKPRLRLERSGRPTQ